MQQSNPLQEKSYAFAIAIIETYKELSQRKEFVLSRQLLRSGTSIGAPTNLPDFSQLSSSLRKTIDQREGINNY